MHHPFHFLEQYQFVATPSFLRFSLFFSSVSTLTREEIKDAFDHNHNLTNLLTDKWFVDKLGAAQEGWRHVTSTALVSGIPIPAIATALTYYDGYRAGM